VPDRKSTQADTPICPLRDQPERITVTDPAHPLFRGEFTLAATTGPAVSGHALVVYRGDVVLRLPIGATSLYPASPRPPSSKLSLAAIRDLVRLASSGGTTGRAAIVETPPVERVEGDADAASLGSPRTTGGEP
jgi:hypothetical protein